MKQEGEPRILEDGNGPKDREVLQEGAGGRGQRGQGRAGHEPAAFGVLAVAV